MTPDEIVAYEYARADVQPRSVSDSYTSDMVKLSVYRCFNLMPTIVLPTAHPTSAVTT